MKERKIIRSIPLTDEQIKTAKVSLQMEHFIASVVADLLEKLAEKKLQERHDIWLSMEQLGNVNPETETCHINWINRTLNVCEQEEE